mmetsp:Transcript_26352/g.55126  ORF Transcript_26352/g.55126 Transcript_26352/m.55126 type:complete len:250 (+) Transcript_26352:1075-1824(+)
MPCRTPGINGSTSSYKSRCPASWEKTRSKLKSCLLSPAGFRKEMLRAPWASVAAPAKDPAGCLGGRIRQNTRILPRSSWTKFWSVRTSLRRARFSCSRDATAISFCASFLSNWATRSSALRCSSCPSFHTTDNLFSPMAPASQAYKSDISASSPGSRDGLSESWDSCCSVLWSFGWRSSKHCDALTSACRWLCVPRRSSTSRKLANQRRQAAASSRAARSAPRAARSAACAACAARCSASRSWSSAHHL